MIKNALYYKHSYLKEFETIVKDCFIQNEKIKVVLEDTAFYPEGGGQNADLGQIDGVKVLFVEEKDSLFNNKKIIKYYDYEKNKNLNPKYITKSSGKRVWWKCDKGHSYQATVHSMDNGMYCPLCREELIKKGGLIPLDDKYIKTLKFSDEIKSLALEFPDIAKEWNYEKNYPVKPENIVSKSHKKIWWICSKCGYEWQTTPLVRVSGRGCKKCGYKSASQKMYKPVLQFDKEGKFIKEYECIDSAIKETGVLHVSCVCRGERKTAGGYIWKYKEQ